MVDWRSLHLELSEMAKNVSYRLRDHTSCPMGRVHTTSDNRFGHLFGYIFRSAIPHPRFFHARTRRELLGGRGQLRAPAGGGPRRRGQRQGDDAHAVLGSASVCNVGYDGVGGRFVAVERQSAPVAADPGGIRTERSSPRRHNVLQHRMNDGGNKHLKETV